MADIFKRLTDDDQTFVSQEVTTGLWTGDTGSITQFFYSTAQLAKANSNYFIDVYNSDPATTSSAEVQYSLAYGNVDGNGSPTLNQSDTSVLATKAVYLQFKNLLLDPTDAQFTFQSVDADEVYLLSVARSRYKGFVDPGNWQLTLSGSNGLFTFIDDSSQTLGSKRSFSKNGLVFNIASGSLSGASGSTVVGLTGSAARGGGFGLFYPQKGIMVLDAQTISSHVGFTGRVPGTVGVLGDGSENTASAATYASVANALPIPLAPFTGSLVGTGGAYSEQFNWLGLHSAIENGVDFQARSAEIISSTHYFLRLNNKEFNYSNNPTFATGSNGQITNTDFEKDPHVFVTTVGLYNDSNELLAVAKTSRPLEKAFSKEALLRVRLDFVLAFLFPAVHSISQLFA
jgi:hypothetical protein